MLTPDSMIEVVGVRKSFNSAGPLARLRVIVGNAVTPGGGYRDGPVETEAELRDLVFPDTESASIVDTYVYYLRRKLGRELGRDVVQTVRGLGYRLGPTGPA